jgi:hypoxanthine-DNA glycosylase
MPSPASRAYGFYYGHPQNRFWRILSAVFDEPYPVSVEDKKKVCHVHGIALWDVLSVCSIDGASDASIRDAEPNDIGLILRKAPGIRRIYTTGKKAAELYKKLVQPATDRSAAYLPSTSPANQGRWPFEKLLELYRKELLK